MSTKLTFAIHTLGCKVNTYESDAMAERLRASGFIERDFTEKADIYIINTCTVTNIADRKSRQMLRRARKLNPNALIVAAGCYVDDAIKNEKLEELMAEHVIDVAVSNKDKLKIVELVNEKVRKTDNRLNPDKNNCCKIYADHVDEGGMQTVIVSADAAQTAVVNTDSAQFLTELDGHSRAFIKVQDGCNMYCSYCIIPYVRGPLKSRPVEDVVKEVRLLGEKGIAEAVITGIHLSSLRNGLLDIIAGIEKIDSIKRIRLGSLEPTLITDEFVSELKKYKKLCPHFHLSLQSGCDEILKRMNRHYTAEQYAASCDILRKYYDHPAITTDIIVGFPGETEEQFKTTCDFAEKTGFYEAHVFKYSRRRGTPADKMAGQLSDAEKSARSEELIKITSRLSKEFREYYIGKQVEMLSEELIEIDGVSYETGYTPEYVRCIRPSSVLHPNSIISGKGLQIIQQNVVDESILLV
ncbi:MAG: tRNA (N(6)-L-threonylcarbamoyladenosine(37)-C(2))-methylthiotransferase MtaB [Eubacteriales bacterium]|nr:tRNA (N(6)-L-threonylcarbamoyladenosine(37)-C(2))-methylthiotransferase MtaB [Eubacteriales bacterium]